MAAEEPGKYGKLFNSIYSIVWFGVPHRGMNTAALEDMVEKESTKDLIGELREGSTWIQHLNEKFPVRTGSINILTCCELDRTPTMKQTSEGTWKRTGPPEMMVDASSACLYSRNEQRLSIKANHSMIAKLSDLSSDYPNIKERLRSFIEAAPPAVQLRLKKEECSLLLSEVYHVTSFVYLLVCMIKARESDVAYFKAEMAQQLTFLEAFSGFLVDDELQKLIDDHTLSTRYPQRILDILHKLKMTFFSFTRLAMIYYEPYRHVIGPGYHSDLRRLPSATTVSQRNITLGEQVLQDPGVSDHLFIEDSLNAILLDCRKSTQGLRETISLATLYSMGCRPQADLKTFQANIEIREMNLAPTMERQNLVRSIGSTEYLPLQGVLGGTPETVVNADLQVMHFQPTGTLASERVIVEYRKYEPEPLREASGNTIYPGELDQRDHLDKIKSKVRHLAGLLHELSLGDHGASNAERSWRGLNYFHCLGFLEQTERYRFAFLFKIPQELSLDSVKNLHSLQSYIKEYKTLEPPQDRPQLGQRYALAYDFCKAVMGLHIYGWVHKSIRSANVILLPCTDDSTRSSSTDTNPGFILYLKGFEYARPGKGKSSGRANFDPETNLYRHPDRQGVPNETFSKDHDLYAVGIILLEIGCWKTMPDLFKNHIEQARKGEAFPGPEYVREKLMERAGNKLAQDMGGKYAQAVQKCIGGFGIIEDDHEKTKLSMAFQQQVLDLLEAGSKF